MSKSTCCATDLCMDDIMAFLNAKTGSMLPRSSVVAFTSQLHFIPSASSPSIIIPDSSHICMHKESIGTATLLLNGRTLCGYTCSDVSWHNRWTQVVTGDSEVKCSARHYNFAASTMIIEDCYTVSIDVSNEVNI